jgi:pyruvate dehydrogenase E2 component (dihydrolipoamide acetyltransferase)
MATEITMPQMGFDMTEGTVANWLKNVGEVVQKGEPIVEIETDKTTIQVEAFANGVLINVAVPAGQKVPVGTVIGQIGDAGEKVTSAPPQSAPPVAVAPQPVALPSTPEPAPTLTSDISDATEITMPQMGFDMTEGTVANWLKNVGDSIKKGEPIVEIETDKTTIQVEAFDSGTLLQIVVPAGQKVPVKTVIGYIGNSTGNANVPKPSTAPAIISTQPISSPQPIPALATTTDNSSANATPIARRMADEMRIDLSQIKGTGPDGRITKGDIENHLNSAPASLSAQTSVSAISSGGRVIASPYAKKLAGEMGLDLSRVKGTGPEGRIVADDVKSYATSQPKVAPTQPAVTPTITSPAITPSSVPAPKVEPVAPAPSAGGTRREPLTKIRMTIAKRLAESKSTVPHYYVSISVEMDAALKMRGEINEALKADGIKVSVNDVVLRATALALKKFPKFNATFAGDAIEYRDAINLGVAVAVDAGLLVVTVRDVDKKSLKQIGAEVPIIAARVREGKGQATDLGGQTFTTSNLGMYGAEEVLPIINQPDSAILGIGTSVQTPVVREGQIVIRNIMKLWLAADHRVTDGASGAQFIAEIKRLLENPWALVL